MFNLDLTEGRRCRCTLALALALELALALALALAPLLLLPPVALYKFWVDAARWYGRHPLGHSQATLSGGGVAEAPEAMGVPSCL